MNRVYTDYIRKAKKRNIPFNLPREYFYELIKKPCYYCGLEESNHLGKLAYNGIDRKDKLDEQGNPFIISDIAKRKEFEDKVQALEKEVVTLDWNKIPREELAGLKLTSEEWLFLNPFLTEIKEA